MFTIVAALKSELDDLIQAIGPLNKSFIENGSLYAASGVHLLRTGIGAENAQRVLNRYLDQFQPEKIINIGTAGALNLGLQSGQIFSITGIINAADVDKIKIMQLQELKNTKSAILLTIDNPVLDEVCRNDLYNKFKADLVDMEGYYFAKIAAQQNIPFYSVKIITDFADRSAETDFLNNYKIFSKRLSNFLFENLF